MQSTLESLMKDTAAHYRLSASQAADDETYWRDLVEALEELKALREANRSRAGKCLECSTAINPRHIGLCDECFRKWLREIDALPAPPEQEPKLDEGPSCEKCGGLMGRNRDGLTCLICGEQESKP